ncbi:MAG: hypothetical protein ACPG06_04660 [Alphaproteobacteria bacterium]
MAIDSPKKTYRARAGKAIQVALDLEAQVASHVRVKAAEAGLTPSDQVRKMVGLDYSPPKRPRLTLSLKDTDYELLGTRYGLPATDTLAIKKRLMEELVALVADP